MAEIPPVLIEFAVGGVQNVTRAFDSIETRVIRLEQASTRSVEGGTRARVRAAESEAEQRGRLADKNEKYIEGVRRRSSEMAGRYAQTLAQKEIREAQLAAREVERLEEYKMKVRIRSSEMAGRVAVAEARKEAEARERFARGIGAASSRGVGSALGGLTALGGGALMIGGGFALADIAKKQLSAERQAALIVNEVTVGGKVAPGASVASILGLTSQVSRQTGMAKGDVQAGLLAYTRAAKGGDFGTAAASMGFFAKLSKTTGTDISEIATGAGLLKSQNQKLGAPQLQQMLLDMMAQGHAGSKSLSEMVGLAGVIGSVRGVYGGDMATNQRKLLGLTQLAAPEAGSAEEAARGVKQMALQVEKGKNVRLLKGWGVKYNEHGQVGDIEQMIGAVLSGTGGNLQQIGKVFETRSGGLMRHMANTFNEAGGGSAGLAAAQAEMSSVTKATSSTGDLDAQFEQLMSTPAEKFQKALNDVSEVLAMRLEPILGKLADKMESNAAGIEKFMTAVLDAAEWLIANPWKGIGAAVSLSLTKELATAAIGAEVNKALTGAIGQKFASGVSIVGASIAVAEVGMLIIDLLSSMEVKKQNQAVNETNQGVNLASDVGAAARGGRVTPQDIAATQAKIAELEAKRTAQQATVEETSKAWTMKSLYNPLSAIAHDDNAINARAQLKATETALKLLETALHRATAAANGNANAQNSIPDPARHQPIASPGRS